MISLTINGQTLEVQEGSTVLQVVEEMGYTIPRLCYHKDLSPFGGCRLCVVQVQGARLPMTSCNLPVSPGLVVQTDTPTVIAYRKAVLRMLLTNYYDAAYTRNNGKFDIDQDNELAFWCRVYEVDIRQLMAKKPFYPVDDDPNPFVWVDHNKCIQCTRCVRACSEIQGRFVWSQAYRGYKARLVAGVDSTMLASRCESCGACVAYCPTGALDNKMSVSAGRADRLVKTTCTYCGVGCQLDLNVKNEEKGERVIRVTSHLDDNLPSINKMHLCLKGRYGYEFIHDPRRHSKPRVRQYLLDGTERPKKRGKFVEVDWDTALDIAARGLRKAHDEHGGDSVAVLASGKLLNEENYLLNKLARQILGTNHIDCAANVYYASVVEGLMESLGLPVMAGSFDDIENNARALLVIGSNLTEQHPVFGAHIRQAILRRKVKMVVASPDFVNIAEYAALELTHHPRSEAALVYGLIYIILGKGWEDRTANEKYAQRFDEVRKLAARYIPQRVAEITGVEVEALNKAAEILAKNSPAAVLWSVGLADPEACKDNVQALVHLQLVLGNLEKVGGGVNPLRSQNNIQGACDLGALPDMLPGYQPVSDMASRGAFEQAWGTALPGEPGLKAAEILAAAGDGRIKALYISGEDILNTSPEAAKVRRSLDNCEFVILQEIMPSETTRFADLVLPGVSFAEKTGTFTSSERRIQMVQQAISPVGQARPDWQIIDDLAQRLIKNGKSFEKAAHGGWGYASTEQVMREIAALTPIYAGVSHVRLAQGARVQWPVGADGEGTARLEVGRFGGK